MSHEGIRPSNINRLAAGEIPFIKIALIGDSGVGKTTLASVLASGCFESSPIYRPTVGCTIKVVSAVHEIQGSYFVELWDLGGNPKFSDARPVCYEDCDGYIFLWDSSSEVTYHSLQSWLAEVKQARETRVENGSRWNDYMESTNGISGNAPESGKYDLEGGDTRRPLDPNSGGNEDASSVPLLVVGNKIDKLTASEKLAMQAACPQQIFVSSRSVNDYDPASFRKFFDEVYDRGRSREAGAHGISMSSRDPQISDELKEKSSQLTTSTPATSTWQRPNGSSSAPSTEPEVTWISPLRGFTSSLFSLSSSASSLRYRSTHTPDHAHAHMPEKI